MVPMVALHWALKVLSFFEGSLTMILFPAFARILAKVPEDLANLPPSPGICSML